MGRRIPKLTVISIGTPPPLLLRPLVDEVPRTWDARQRAQARPDGGRETVGYGPPKGSCADEGSA